MKKLVLSLIAIGFLASACGGGEQPQAEETNTEMTKEMEDIESHVNDGVEELEKEGEELDKELDELDNL